MAVMGRSYPNRPIVIPRIEWPSGRDVSTGASLAITTAWTEADTTGGAASLTVTASITAAGIIGLGPVPTYIVNEQAITSADFYARRGFPNRPVIETGSMQPVAGQGSALLTVTAAWAETDTTGGTASLTVTAGFTADGTVVAAAVVVEPVIATTIAQQTALYYRTYGQGLPTPAVWSRASTADQAGGSGAQLAVTASIVANGFVAGPAETFVVNASACADAAQVYRGLGKGFPNRPVYTWRSSIADLPGLGNANLPITVGITETDTTGGSTSLTVTAGFTADGIVGLGPSPTYIVNQPAIRLSVAWYRLLGKSNQPVLVRNPPAIIAGQGDATLPISVGIIATGVAATSSGASLTITVSETATGGGAVAGSSAPTWTVGIVAAGAVTGAAARIITVGITATGNLAATGTALLTVIAGIFPIPVDIAIPPFTVTGTTGPVNSVTGSAPPTTTVTGTTATLVTVR